MILEPRDRLSAAGLDAGPDTIAWHLTLRQQASSEAQAENERLNKQIAEVGFELTDASGSTRRFAITPRIATWWTRC